MLDFLSPLSLIPGMGPKRIAALQESGITTIGELLYHFPHRYLDRSVVLPLGQISAHLTTTVTVSGTIDTVRYEMGRHPRLRAKLRDHSGSIDLLWLRGALYFRSTVKEGARLVATGKISSFGSLQIIHPAIETLAADASAVTTPVVPIYHQTSAMSEAGLTQKMILKCIQWILKNLKHYPQTLPGFIQKKWPLEPLATSLKELHTPTTLANLEPFRLRIRFEELYQLAIILKFSRKSFSLPGRPLTAGNFIKRFLTTIPFTLTPDQKAATATLLREIGSSRRMHRLLQGDVGSGKTIVAFIATLPSLRAGLQVIWMAPTEILAQQTWRTITTWLKPLGLTAELLTSGSTARSERPALLKKIASGEARFIVGTHALLQPTLSFHQVGITVIDEQHRFGAEQRLHLQQKDTAADFLLMTATPIPQTLAQTMYNDLDIVTIRHLPPGRHQVTTHLVPEHKRPDLELFIRKQLNAGNQAYYIVPRIDDESVDTPEGSAPIQNITTTFKKLTKGPFSENTVASIHGKLSTLEKTTIMSDFATGKIELLLATSVIEVGIDVARASVIVIENSERFGLAQLHQLRGRVGRGGEKSYCFLLSPSCSDEQTLQRLSYFCKNNDGFTIAEVDLKLRGPGDVDGYKQSGWDNLRMADIIKDAELFVAIRAEIELHLQGH